MPIARKLGEFDYVLEEERKLPREKQTVFRLRTLTYTERESIGQTEWVHTPEGIEPVVNKLALARRVLAHGLVGWRNFRDEDGKEVEFKKATNGALDANVLDLIQVFAIELGDAVWTQAIVTEGEAKN